MSIIFPSLGTPSWLPYMSKFCFLNLGLELSYPRAELSPMEDPSIEFSIFVTFLKLILDFNLRVFGLITWADLCNW